MNFKGKVAVVTGGASGIGRAAVQGFASHGATVVFIDLNEAGAKETISLVEQAGGKAAFQRLDITDNAAVTAFAAQVQQDFGKADILVNVAGWDIQEPFMNNTPEFWDKVININLMGTVRMCRAFLPQMIEAKAGVIVNTSSDAGRVGSSGETIYSGAKGGVIAFTKSLAREMARNMIRVNCVAPGPTDTPLFRQAPEKLQEALIKAIPMRRLGKPSDIANGMMFFASDYAEYVTGQVLSVSGGLTMVD
ncbi:MAG: SDR family NAD(P)-dependent oxidoreductase [Alphaproteobacteria bacterium]